MTFVLFLLLIQAQSSTLADSMACQSLAHGSISLILTLTTLFAYSFRQINRVTLILFRLQILFSSIFLFPSLCFAFATSPHLLLVHSF
jgi:hypothetical protein